MVEAKARKQKRLRMRLTSARQKAEAVSNQEDVPLKQKMREIEKIYNQVRVRVPACFMAACASMVGVVAQAEDAGGQGGLH